MQLKQIVTDSTGMELTQRGTPLFPFSLYENDMHAFPAHSVPWHWHAECEFCLVTAGSVVLETAAGSHVLDEEEGAFVNSNALHAMHPLTPDACRMTTIVFDPGIVGSAATIFHTRYVAPLMRESAGPCVAFGRESDVLRKTVVGLLRDIGEIFAAGDFGYELRIRNALSLAWLQIIGQADTTSHKDDPYIRKMLSFVHTNYGAPLTLEEVAKSADVSCRTCSRSFRSQLHTSVFGYVQDYRVKMAAEKLVTTEDGVTDICFLCGFADPSYFTRVFRAKTGMSPTEFRREARLAGTEK